MRPKVDLIAIEGTFSNWVEKQTDWIKKNSKDKTILIERIQFLKEEGVSISDKKIEQLIDRIKKSKNEFQIFSVFYHAAISHLNIDK